MSKKYIKQQNNDIKRNQRIEIIVTAAHTVVSLELFFFLRYFIKIYNRLENHSVLLCSHYNNIVLKSYPI